MIKEIENFLNGEDIDDSIHVKMFQNEYFELLTSKICYESYRIEINGIKYADLL